MLRKIAGFTISALALLCLAAAPASASAAGPDQPPAGCFGNYYGIFLGQAVAVNCGYPGEGYGYRAIAHCTSGGTFWFSAGTFVPYGFGPSVAECEGGLLSPAAVGGYHVIQN
jgi:hypothetical protein